MGRRELREIVIQYSINGNAESFLQRKKNQQTKKPKHKQKQKKILETRSNTFYTEIIYFFFTLLNTISFSLPLQLNTLTLLIKEYVEID